jgi:YhcH/YjgK/YiaL family protein
MIHAPLSHAERYFALHPLLAPAFAWLSKHTPDTLPNGHTTILGDDLSVWIDDGKTTLTSPISSKRFETHRRYIDLQVVLAGPHVMVWSDADQLGVVEDFKPDNDIRFHTERPDGLPGSPVYVGVNEFVIFFPEDAHKPFCNPPEAPGPIPQRRAVFKLAATPTL